MRRLLVLVALVLAGAPGTLLAQSIAGNWQGTITFGSNPPLRVGLVVTDAPDGPSGTLVIIDQDGARIPVQQATLTGNAVRLVIPNIGSTYEGMLSADRSEINGAMGQPGGAIPLNFKRVAALDAVPLFGEAERTAVAEVINGYFASFTANDFQRFATYLQAPFARWPMGGSVTTMISVEEVVAGMRNTRAGLEGTDYAVSRAAEMIITPTSANSAMVDIHWRRDRKDGSLFQEGAEILTVVKTPSGWKINGNLARALTHYRKVF